MANFPPSEPVEKTGFWLVRASLTSQIEPNKQADQQTKSARFPKGSDDFRHFEGKDDK